MLTQARFMQFLFWPGCSGVKAQKLQLCPIALGSSFTLWDTSFSMHLQGNKVLSMFVCSSFLSQETQVCVHPPIPTLDLFTRGLILTWGLVVYRLYTSLWNYFFCSFMISELFQFLCFVLPRGYKSTHCGHYRYVMYFRLQLFIALMYAKLSHRFLCALQAFSITRLQGISTPPPILTLDLLIPELILVRFSVVWMLYSCSLNHLLCG